MYANIAMGFAIALLIVLSAFFSSLETAYSTVNNVRLRHKAENGSKKAKNALFILDRYDKAISTILIGNNIVNITCSSLATVLCINLFGSYGAAISTFATTLLVLTFGEIIPKNSAKDNAERICLSTGAILKGLMFIFTPFNAFFSAIKNFANKRVGATDNIMPSVTEDELKFIVESIEEEGVLEEQEREMVQSVLDFDETTAQQIITPRVNITAVDVNDSIEVIKQNIFKTRFSRIPVYEDSIDNIIGILLSREFLEELVHGRTPNVRELMHQPYFVYKTKNLTSILNEFKRNKTNFAIVSDDYGGTLGIITMEDLLEEIVGEIWDEDEEIENEFEKTAENVAEVSGDMNIDDVLDIFDLKEDYIESDSVSAGGWAMEYFEHVPERASTFKYKDLLVKVMEVSDRHISKLLIKFEPEPKQDNKGRKV